MEKEVKLSVVTQRQLDVLREEHEEWNKRHDREEDRATDEELVSLAICQTVMHFRELNEREKRNV